jgi:tetratricopeptide (TPR) repeat protein
LLATGSERLVVWLWNLRDPNANPNRISLWNLQLNELIEAACRRAGRNLTYDEQKQYLGGEIYRRTCENIPLHTSFIDAGRERANKGDVQGAITHFSKVLAVDPSSSLVPEIEARRIAAEASIAKAEKTASDGNMERAIAIFREAIELNSRLNFDLETEARRFAAVGAARARANEDDFEGAMTRQESYTQMEEVEKRLVELLSYHRIRLAYRKRTEMAVEMVRLIESEGQFPEANYAFDNGVLTLDLTQLIESKDKHWVSEIECSRHINWEGHWRRVDEVEDELRAQRPESFRPIKVEGRNGEEWKYWAFTKVVRLKRYGRKRLVIVHEKEDLSDAPRFLLTDALHWESGRVIETWTYRWPSEIFHEFSKQVTGFESAQVRKEEAVKRHFRLSCVAQSLVQQAACSGGKSERFAFADEKATVGQKVYTIAREALAGVLQFAQGLFAQGRTCDQVLEGLMPA